MTDTINGINAKTQPRDPRGRFATTGETDVSTHTASTTSTQALRDNERAINDASKVARLIGKNDGLDEDYTTTTESGELVTATQTGSGTIFGVVDHDTLVDEPVCIHGIGGVQDPEPEGYRDTDELRRISALADNVQDGNPAGTDRTGIDSRELASVNDALHGAGVAEGARSMRTGDGRLIVAADRRSPETGHNQTVFASLGSRQKAIGKRTTPEDMRAWDHSTRMAGIETELDGLRRRGTLLHEGFDVEVKRTPHTVGSVAEEHVAATLIVPKGANARDVRRARRAVGDTVEHFTMGDGAKLGTDTLYPELVKVRESDN